MTLLRQGAFADAVKLIVEAPALYRNTQSVQRTLAAAHAQAGDLFSAQAAIDRALMMSPPEPATIALAGRIALDQAVPERAFPYFESLVQIAPAQTGFWRYLWDAASTPAARARALQLTESLSVDASADVRIAWAVCRELSAQSRGDEAVLLAKQTFLHHRDHATAQCLWVKQLIENTPLTALQALAELPLPPLTELTPDAVDARLTLPENYPDETTIDGWRASYREGLAQIVRLANNPPAELSGGKRLALVRHTAFRLAYQGRNDLVLQSTRGDWLATLMRPITPRLPNRGADRGKKIRVAFASKHIRDCTVGQYFKRFFTHLADENETDIEVFIYACGKRDAFTDTVQTGVAQLTHFDDDDKALPAMASAIAADAPDVLIYPEIGMEPIIEKLAAMRLAPLQCMLWGHPVTSGLPTIDVFFSADALEPDDAQKHYRERLQLLPGLGTCYPSPPLPSVRTRKKLGLPDDVLLIACTQLPLKWNPQFTQTVGEILLRSPTAKLVVFDSPAIERSHQFDAYLRHFFARVDIDFESRVIRLPQRSRADFLAVLSACDLALDTFGFSGGNTSLDALSVGLPIITSPGEFMRGRQTFAMLRMLPEAVAISLIAADQSDYVKKATQWLRDGDARKVLRATIQHNSHRLFNDREPVDALRRWLTRNVPFSD